MEDMKEVIEDVKIRSDIHDIISEYVHLKPSGTNYKGLCPFHNEKTPSFLVSTTKQIYKCFGCGEYGDVITFIMKVENLQFMDAVRFLANKCGIEIDNNIDEETKILFAKSKRYQMMHTESAQFYYQNLVTNKDAQSYLRKRGLDEKTIKNFGLGYSPDSWNSLYNHLLSKGYKPEEIKEAGLAGISKKNTYYDKFRNRIMFPIFDYKNNIIAFGGRVLDDSLPKYLNSEDTIIFNKRANLFGLNIARKNIDINRTLILVEGYMDLISLYQFGIRNVVATLGTALTDNQAQLIKRFADNVVLSYDSDDAGIRASIRAIDILEKNGLKSSVLNLGRHKDPDEYIRNEGLNSFLTRVDKAKNGMYFKIDTLYKTYNHNNVDDTIKFVKEALKMISVVKSPIEIDIYEKYLSKLCNIDLNVIKSEMAIYSRQNIISKNKWKKKEDLPIRIKKEEIIVGTYYIELYLLKIMMLNIDARDIVISKISIEDFSDDNCKKLYSYIYAMDEKKVLGTKDLDVDIYGIKFLRDLDTINLNYVDFNDTREINKVINNLLKKCIINKIEALTSKASSLELQKKENPDNEQIEMELLNIALEIVSEKKKLKSL